MFVSVPKEGLANVPMIEPAQTNRWTMRVQHAAGADLRPFQMLACGMKAV